MELYMVDSEIIGTSNDKSCYLTSHRGINQLCDDYKSLGVCAQNLRAVSFKKVDDITFVSIFIVDHVDLHQTI